MVHGASCSHIRPCKLSQPPLEPRHDHQQYSHWINEFAEIRSGKSNTSASHMFWGTLLVLIGMGPFLLVPVGLGPLILIAICMIAAKGAIILVIGNGILRAAYLDHYTSNGWAAAIGAAGACITAFIDMLTSEHRQHWFIAIPFNLLLYTLYGSIGAFILPYNHIERGGIDVLHATKASALGAVVSFFVGPLLMTVVLYPFLWAIKLMDLNWVSARSSESWDGIIYRRSMTYGYVSSGGDPEVDQEIEAIRQAEARQRRGVNCLCQSPTYIS
ncbi:hypothetical protein M413DRAFT_146544 [Hebeloma cylindrosporum]|uniref:Uncharacterized protein n=1 Tax=Hebeloma cylindrosporum TaxID=76867 RepID=A0A0C3CAU3_HEBCY|nr:hypothetical protein M413DRAFT_146544 [Hebeloma cylindrosporum h7]